MLPSGQECANRHDRARLALAGVHRFVRARLGHGFIYKDLQRYVARVLKERTPLHVVAERLDGANVDGNTQVASW